VLSAVIVIVILLTALYVVKRNKLSAGKQMALILKPYIQNEEKDIIIPDGIGGLLEIENLILTDRGLLLIETYPMSGNLFGSETIEQWTQIIDGRSYKFANPLRHIRTSRQALMVLAPNIPIFCRIVFNADSIFPKGKPEEVSVLSSLAEDLLCIDSSPLLTEQSKQAWEVIMRIARKDGQAVNREGSNDGG